MCSIQWKYWWPYWRPPSISSSLLSTTHMEEEHASRRNYYNSKIEFENFICIKEIARKGQNTHKSDFRGPKILPGVWVEHKHVVLYVGHLHKPFWTKKKLTRLAGGVREGQNMAHLGHFNEKCAQMHYFDLPWPPLPTRSNFFGPKWLVQVSHI